MLSIEPRLPPFALDMEQAILSGIMMDASAIPQVTDWITSPEDFYEPRHKILYGAILEQYESGKPVDYLAIAEKLKQDKKLEKAGGIEYLSELTTALPTAADLGYYSQIVREKSLLRKVIEVGGILTSNAYQDGVKADELIDSAEKLLFEAAAHKSTFSHIRDLLGPVLKRLEALSKTKAGITGLPSGFYDLDKLTAGFQASDLVILAARPSVGKSSLGLNMACNAALRSGKPVAIFSLEMSKEQLVERMIASEARVNASDMRRGMLGDDAWPRIGHVMSELYNAPIYIDDSFDLSVLELRAKARKLAKEANIGMIIVDYLQLLRTPQKTENRVQEISQMTRSLKALARELNIPVIVQSQLSRSVEQRQDRRPVLSDLRESGSIEQDADVVMFLSHPEAQKERDLNIIDLVLAKQRNGPVGVIKLKFLRQFTRFESLAAPDGNDFEI